MWTTIRDWKNRMKSDHPDSWVSCKWESLVGEQVETDVTNYKAVLNKCKRAFKSKPETAVFAEIIDKNIQEIQAFDK